MEVENQQEELKRMNNRILISEDYIFVVDTDSFSEDFVDHLTSYCTGFNAETYNEMKYIDLFQEQFDQNPFKDLIENKELGDILSPCCIWLNRNYGTDEDGNFAKLTEENYQNFNFPAPFSVGIFMNEPTEEQINLIKTRTKEFFEIYEPKVNLEGFRLIKHVKYAEEKDLD